MMKYSKELHVVMSSAYVIYHEFALGGVRMNWGFTDKGGYFEEINNEDARKVFVQIYHLAQELRTLIESPMARNLRRLERLTLRDQNFQRMFQNVQDDLDIHSWD